VTFGSFLWCFAIVPALADERTNSTAESKPTPIANVLNPTAQSDTEIYVTDETALRFDDASLAKLQLEPRTTGLYLRGTRISDAGMPHIATFAHLKRLAISDCPLTDAGLKSLNLDKMPLESLDLANTQITDESLEVIGRLTKLTSLTIRGDKISNRGLIKLKRLKNLTALDVSQTEIDDDGLTVIQSMWRLERLYCFDTRITRKSFALLKRLPNLRTLGIAYTYLGEDPMDGKSFGFSEADYHLLQRELPKVSFIGPYYET
jgi:hypothetical protein